MIPSGAPTPVGGDPSANPSVLRTNSGQVGFVPSQSPFSSLVSPRNQFNNSNNMGLLGNLSNVNSLLNSSFGNGGPGSITGMGNSHVNGLQQRGGMGVMDMGSSAEPDPLSFASSSGQAQGQNFANPAANQMGSDHNLAQQVEASQNFQQHFSVPQSQQQKLRGGPGMGQGPSVKMESQMSVPDQMGPQSQLPLLRNLGSVKLEPQQLQAMRNLGPVKLEGNQHSADPSIFLHQQQQQHQHQQQQQQQLYQLSRQSSQAAAQMNLMQQQRLVQIQQQQQLLKTLPQQRSQFQQQQQQQQQQQPQQPQQGLTMRPQARPSVFEPGVCARRLTHYMYKQQHRPADNNIDFWRKFVSEFFAPRAKKRWCVSLYGSGRQTSGVFPQDVWHCEICNRKPGRGFETTVEVLPRLCKIKYDSGTLEELLYVDMPHEYQNPSGQIVLDYAKAIQESVFEQLRVVRDGQLRVVFNSDLKICSWEFCARRHEELIPRRLIVPQVSQLGAVAQKYQSTAQNTSSTSNLSPQDLQTTCNSFVASARQLAKSLEVPLVNDLGYTKRYVRCLQISEVVNSMKDLIDYSRETGTGPMASLVNFPRAPSGSTMSHLAQHSEEQQTRGQSSIHNDQNSGLTSVQHTSLSNGVLSANKSMNPASSTASASAIVGLLHQNSMNSRQENSINNMSSPYVGGNAVQIPSASSSSAPPQPQPNGPNPSSPFPSPTPSATNNGPQVSRNDPSLSNGSMPTSTLVMQQTANQSNDTDMGDPQSSVHQIIQEAMMSSQMNGGGSVGNGIKGINGMTQTLPGGNCMPMNGITNHSSIGSMGYGSMGGVGPGATASGIRTAMMNNSMALTGRGGINQLGQETSTINHQQQQNYGNRLLNGFGRANSFNNLNFDWKNTP